MHPRREALAPERETLAPEAGPSTLMRESLAPHA